MKNSLTLVCALILSTLVNTTNIFAQANTELSNLVSPTKVNVNLLPVSDNTKNLGSVSKSWKDIYLDGFLYLNGNKFLSSTGTGNTGAGRFTLNSNTGGFNTAVGYVALYNNATGNSNTAEGYASLYSNTTGSFNVGLGQAPLYYNTTGSNNIGIGLDALRFNTTGNSNVAIGINALYKNTTRSNLVAIGDSALYNNGAAGLFDGTWNTAIGSKALFSNTTGSENAALGTGALFSNTSGYYNTASGVNALYSNTTGSNNTASGDIALYLNTTGSYNTASGRRSLFSNTTGWYNTASGSSAGSFNDANKLCTFIGYDADQIVSKDLSNSMALGSVSRITDSNQVRIGNSSVTSIGGYTGWTNLSDGRYKKNLKENVPGLEFINKLKPLTYCLDVSGLSDFLGEDNVLEEKSNEEPAVLEQARKDKEKIIYSGFVAQDVEKAANDVGYDFSGVDKPQNKNSLYGLRYAEFVVPLVKAVQELDQENARLLDGQEKLKMELSRFSRENSEQQKEIEELKAAVTQLQSSLVNPDKNIGTGRQSSTPEGFAKPATNVIPGAVEVFLGQNIPNPFTGKTIIQYIVPENISSAQIKITNQNGMELKAFDLLTNQGSVEIDASQMTSGNYQYSLIIDGRVIDTKQMVLTK